MTSTSEAGVPEISVVVPCYRGGELLGEGIDSIFAQTFKNYEIVLVDNNAGLKASEIRKECAASPWTIGDMDEPVLRWESGSIESCLDFKENVSL